MLIPPETAQVTEFPTSVFWFDEEGVVYSITKPTAHAMDKEESIEYIRRFRELVNNQKVCIIIQSNSSNPLPNKEDREWIASELETLTKAMAVIYTSPMGRMMANLFFRLKPSKYPVKFFANAADAREWIDQYVDKK